MRYELNPSAGDPSVIYLDVYSRELVDFAAVIDPWGVPLTIYASDLPLRLTTVSYRMHACYNPYMHGIWRP